MDFDDILLLLENKNDIEEFDISNKYLITYLLFIFYILIDIYNDFYFFLFFFNYYLKFYNYLKNKIFLFKLTKCIIYDRNKSCSICLNNLNNIVIQLKCKHYFHKKCIIQWLDINKTCPLCRYKV